MGLFLVGLLTGLFLGVLFRDISRYTMFWFLLNISEHKRKRKVKKTIKQIEDHINEE